MSNPYIGVTGFTTLEEVKSALANFPVQPKRDLMAGFLVSWKSLRGFTLKPKWQRQFPKINDLEGLMVADLRLLNLAHYSSEEGQEASLIEDLEKINDLSGHSLHGFQLNLAWPSLELMEEFRSTMRGYDATIILQLGQKAVELVGNTPKAVVEKLKVYANEGFIDGVLFDPSGGLGQAFDTERARQFLRAIAQACPDLGLGVAGGLGPDSLGLVEPLLDELPHLSIDAQGQLRDANFDLDLDAVKQYLERSAEMFSRY